MELQVHQMAQLEGRERNYRQLVSHGMLTLQDVSRIFTLFFQYSNDANDKCVKTNGPLGLLAG